MSRYISEKGEINMFAAVRDGAIGVLALLLAFVFWPLQTVPTGTRGVITLGGNVKGIEAEGFTWVWPWERLHVFNVRADAAHIDNSEGATSDTQPVHVSLTVRYAVLPDRIDMIFREFSKDGNMDPYIETAAADVFKATTARYVATELISKRPAVASDIHAALVKKTELYGVRILGVDIRNFQFSKSYMDAINQKATQEQLRFAEENKAKTVEATQRQQVIMADAAASAAKATADGQAYAQLKLAQAQADALRIQNAALAQNKDVLELRRIEVEMEKARRWNGALPQSLYGGAPVPFLQVK
jgi:prohibitin 2